MDKNIILQATAEPVDDGFDIIAISEGEAKGWNINFSAPVLQSAIDLYQDKPVFIDHAKPNEHPSVRNLAGTLTDVSWSDEDRGIRARLTPSGPAAEVLIQLQRAAKSNPSVMKTVGFSTHLFVKLNAKREVTKINSVQSVDAVIDPARGGKFLSALGQMKGENLMTDKTQEENGEELTEQTRAALELQGANDIAAKMQAQLKEQNDIHIANLRALLDNSLAASKLPSASQKAVRKPFEAKLNEGQTFKPTDLQEAITDKRAELAELSENTVQGPGRSPQFSSMFTGADQFKAALADLLGAPRDEEFKNIKVRPLMGIREAYILATGDIHLMGGYHEEYALVSANFPSTVADLLNKILVKAWDDFGKTYGWWEKIATVEHFTNLQDIKWVKTGTIATLPDVDERGEYTELPIGDSREVSAWGKSGGYIPLTIEAIINDDIRAFRNHPKEAALAGRRNISEKVAEIFTQNSGAGPALQDGGNLFNATAVTTTGGHANLLTTALGTDYTAWNAASLAMFKQPLPVKDDNASFIGTGKRQAVRPKYCLVPADLKAQADALFIPRWASAVEAIAAAGGPSFAGLVEPVEVPEWTDVTDWAAVADPMLYPGIMIGEIFGLMPQLFSASRDSDPAMFSNDESRLKVRQFLNVGVADFRPLHKNNVAG